eukprot:3328177-Amphidinium_carterae.1
MTSPISMSLGVVLFVPRPADAIDAKGSGSHEFNTGSATYEESHSSAADVTQCLSTEPMLVPATPKSPKRCIRHGEQTLQLDLTLWEFGLATCP